MEAVELMEETQTTKAIVFFDGYCGLCNNVVDRLMRLDKNGELLFSPLQGETAKAKLKPEDIKDLNTVVVSYFGVSYRRSDAILLALNQIGGFYSMLSILGRTVPRPIRDLIYKIVASNRYKIFGKRDTCRLPSKEERARFLP